MKPSRKPQKKHLQEVILSQREAIVRLLEPALKPLARQCAGSWGQRREINALLASAYREIPYCHLFYALDTQGQQVSANVFNGHVDQSAAGQNLADRPYMQGVLPFRGVALSPVYISRVTDKPCITALHAVTGEDRMLGLVVADFSLRDLPLSGELYQEQPCWRQIRGDPAIRSTLFMQQRTPSLFDQHADAVLSILEELITSRGVFHTKIHYSSSRATLWLTADPYTYRILAVEELIQPDTCLAYPLHPYPGPAQVSPHDVRPILDRFLELRTMDETVYLRSSSLNVINGMVGLTFSCDGSHYMPAGEFLDRTLDFWYGTSP